MRRGLLALVLPALCVAAPAAADTDTQLWTRFGVGKEVVDGFEVELRQTFRFDENVSRVSAILPAVGLDYRPQRWLQLGGGYRLGYQRRRNGEMDFRHRLHVQSQVRHDLGAFRVRYRVRLQGRFRDERDPVYAFRNRVGVDYRGIRPWVPGLQVESNHRLNDPVHSVVFHKARFTARMRYGWRDLTFGVFYRLEIPILRFLDPTLHIAGVTVDWEL